MATGTGWRLADRLCPGHAPFLLHHHGDVGRNAPIAATPRLCSFRCGRACLPPAPGQHPRCPDPVLVPPRSDPHRGWSPPGSVATPALGASVPHSVRVPAAFARRDKISPAPSSGFDVINARSPHSAAAAAGTAHAARMPARPAPPGPVPLGAPSAAAAFRPGGWPAPAATFSELACVCVET
ncbi:uncharacterized protein LOC128802489 [Vidua chalybeata]|uniref:uncharacterized protein LOC128802489 n=1 Tax=Vidua chalybeata TaxID=81927 RepID=UPI0023A81F9F|nr:uncharacterized protein LOC128802489 [Vidua chalybeata]